MSKKGLILGNIDEKDWIFGADNGIIKKKIPNLAPYLPSTESQRFKNFDPWWCIIASDLNIIETKFNYIIANGLMSDENLVWLTENEYFDDKGNINFDDWFIARVSNTIPGKGNGFGTVANAIRKYGLTPQRKSSFKMSDYNNDLDDYNQEIPLSLYDLGKEFNKRFQLNYEVVYVKDFHEALQYGPIQVGVSNWMSQNGVYQSNGRIIHATMLFGDFPWEVFDSYSPFIKNLAENYFFMHYGYQWYISEVKHNTLINKIMDKFLRLKNGAIYFLKAGTKQIQKVEPENAGLAAITFLTRKFGVDNIEDKTLEDYEIVNKFF